ncbi:MAG TPA: hypothetical protein VFB34_08720 [Chloroflexota bacterium]|nr:hypothetical protein [Chloroflexota bacterium]
MPVLPARSARMRLLLHNASQSMDQWHCRALNPQVGLCEEGVQAIELAATLNNMDSIALPHTGVRL